MQPHNFFSTDATPWHPNSPPRPGEAPHPAPSARKSATQTAQKTALCAPWGHLPLDEVPVHVHRFAARAPCDSKGSECQCGIHTAEAASALRSRKTQRAAKEDQATLTNILITDAAG